MTLLAAAGWALGPLPDGHYGGSGEVNANCRTKSGKFFAYRSEIVIQGNTVTDIDHFGGGRPDARSTKKFVFSSSGFFTFTADPPEDGEGFCGKNACYWQADFRGTKGGDTLSFDGKTIWLLGWASVENEVWVCEKQYDRKL